MKLKSPIALIILDGYGYSKETNYNAIYKAKKPNIDNWLHNFPFAFLHASGQYVGLPEDFIGNSEVGHITIGAGKRVKQPLTIILEAIENKTFFHNEILNKNLEKLKNVNGDLHLIGLLSDAGVHSHEKILYAFIQAAEQHKIRKIFVHVILDGRDVFPKSAKIYLSKLQKFISQFDNVVIGTLQGRFYAMDRDNNWNRTELAYNNITSIQPNQFKNPESVLDYYYKENITDEFIPPIQLDSNSIIKNDDGIIFFNIRPDRIRQLVKTFEQKDFKFFSLEPLHLTFVITPISYDKNNSKTISLFKEEQIQNGLMDIFAKNEFTTFSIAETEKYAHVTYFFKCGREEILRNETQVLIPSIKSQNYINYPCMSSEQITETVINSLKTNPRDFYLINYANADMVGHSGDFQATVKAIECLDNELGKIYYELIVKMNGTLYITADHGKAEFMFDKVNNQPYTAHTRNLVPFIMIKKELLGKNEQLPLKELADIAPFILKNIETI